MTTEAVQAGVADLEALSQVIADAFHELAPSLWLIADPVARRSIFPGYFAIFVEHALATGLVHTTPSRDAVAIWLPAAVAGSSPPLGYDARLSAATSPWTDRFLVFDEALDAGHPAGPAHHHLAILAVRPGRQGRGTGTGLLRAQHRVLDATGMPAYLEASDLRNRQLYLRHGYVDHGEPIQLPSGPAMYPMWRPARAGQDG